MTDLRRGARNRRAEYYDRFEPAEMDRRLRETRAMMRREDLDALLVYGDAGVRHNVEYLTNYAPDSIAYFLLFADPDEPTLLLEGIGNHVQYVREVCEADAVREMYPGPATKLNARLDDAGVGDGTVGIVGARPQNGYFPFMPNGHYEALGRELVDSTQPFTEVVAVKSEPELDRIRAAAALTDRCMEVIAEEAAPGVTEVDLMRAIDRALFDEAGGRGTTFITAGPMEGGEPGATMPWHRPSRRPIQSGDVITTEVGAAYKGYRSQIHRPFTVGRGPTAEWEAIWALLEETYGAMLDSIRPGNTARDLYEAVAPIENSEYKMYDVLVHGYGNGIIPPLLGTEDSEYWPGGSDGITADWTFDPGHVMAVQPNVVTEDERLGMQLGAVVVVRDGSPEVLQEYPLEFGRV